MLQHFIDRVRLWYERWSSSHRLNGGADAATHGHEADLRAILANTPFLLTRCSADLRYLFVSEAYARMVGRPPKDFEGRLIADIMGEEGLQTILPHVRRVLRGEPVEYEDDVSFSEVGPRHLLVRYTPDRDRGGDVTGWIASILDLTDQKRTAADLEALIILREIGSFYVRRDVQPDECLQRTLDAAITIARADKGNIQLYEASSNGLVLAAHRGFAEPFLTFFKHVRGGTGACAAAMRMRRQMIVEDVLESDIFVGDEAQAVLVNAGVRAVISTPLVSSSGTLLGIISTHYANPHEPTDREVHLIELLARQAADCLDRKQMEARLVEREAQLSMFVEHAPAAIAMFDDKMRYLAVSRRYISDFRLPPEADLIGRSHYEIFPDIPPRWRKVHARVLAGEELAHEEDPFLRQDGHIDWCRWLMKPWRTADGQIGGALLFSEVINERVEARRALGESEARFRATFENAAVGIAHVASDGRWLRANGALCHFLGYPLNEILTKTFRQVTYSDDLVADVAQADLMREGKIETYDIEKRYVRKDGAVVWGRKTASCVRKGDGSIDYFVFVIQDISARKAREEQVQFLMREVNHRANNMLSLVQAIARQTAAREPGDFLERFTDRLQALAANQKLLVRNEWQGVDLDELIRTQLAHFADLWGSRVTVDGPKLRLCATASQAIGLAIHELATNAGKYGALSTNTGRVDVRWATDGDTFTISWTEREGPPVSPPERRGFGSTVVASMVKTTLGGEVHLDYAPSGLVWHLTCPARKALEPR